MPSKWRNSPTSFGLTSKIIHWAMAVLIIGLFALGQYLANNKIGVSQLYLYGWHKSAGMLALTLALIRVAWVIRSKPPAPLGADGWQKTAAKVAHHLLYLLMLTVPLSGYIASSASGFEMSFFGLFPIPLIGEANTKTEDFFFAIHHFATRALLVVFVLHVVGALFRQFGKKDGTLRRIWF